MRAGRLLHLLLLLQTRGQMTAAQLAAELEVSERTVYRDVESLSGAGIPVYAERGSGGGYRLLEGYRTRLTGLTGDEAQALSFAGAPAAATELGLGADLAVARLKLLAALPGELRERAERVRARFHLDTAFWWSRPDQAPHLSALAGAVWAEHTIEVAYRRRDGTAVPRTLDPLGLVLKGGAWYVLALPHPAGQAVRTFRVSRISRLTDTGRTFTRPDGFDLARAWREQAHRFEASRHSLQVRVRLTRRGVDMVRALSAPLTADGLAGAEPGPDGWCEAALAVESVDHAVAEFAAYGPDLEVLEPLELRKRLAAYARATAARYEGD